VTSDIEKKRLLQGLVHVANFLWILAHVTLMQLLLAKLNCVRSRGISLVIGSEAANLIRDRILLKIDEFCSLKTRTLGARNQISKACLPHCFYNSVA